MSTTMRRGTLLVLVLGLGALAPADPQPADPNRALAGKQLKLIADAETQMDQLFRGGELSASDPRHSLWARRKVEALRTSGAGKLEMIAALEVHLSAMKKQLDFAKQAYQKDMLTRLDVEDVEYRAVEAEVWLNQEKAR